MGDVVTVVVGAVAVILFAAIGAVWVHIVGLRSAGVPVIVRRLPAAGRHGWRHGVLRFDDRDAVFYKLRRVFPGAAIRFRRCGLDIADRRQPTKDELAAVMNSDLTIYRVGVDGEAYEIALDTDTSMALLSWTESRPSERLLTDGL